MQKKAQASLFPIWLLELVWTQSYIDTLIQNQIGQEDRG